VRYLSLTLLRLILLTLIRFRGLRIRLRGIRRDMLVLLAILAGACVLICLMQCTEQ